MGSGFICFLYRAAAVVVPKTADNLLVPEEPVILGALARAQAERGEDGGVQAGETYQLMKQSLADAIALESGRYLEEQEWVWN